MTPIFNLSLDDFSPHPRTQDLTYCNHLISFFPDIKIDLFVPAAYGRLGEKTYPILDKPWLQFVKSLPPNYKVNLHGFYHRRTKADFSWHSGHNSNNNEWELLNELQATYLLDRMEASFRGAKLKHAKVFRPPGWYISQDAARVLRKRGYLVAGDKKHMGKQKKEDKIGWVLYNYDMTGPWQRVDQDCFAFGHTSDWTNNFMDETRFRYLKSLLEAEKFEFKFLEEMRDY